MSVPKTIGFPRMMKEAGEKRVFLPEFIHWLAEFGMDVYVEEGYGSRSGFTFEDYRQAIPQVYQCTRQEAFQQDVVLVLRSPTLEEYEWMPRGATLVSMLHFPTRPRRVKKLDQLGIRAISLDSIANDNGLRLVENMKAVAWNGLEAAFDVLEKRMPGLVRPNGDPLRVLIIGAGMVGKHAVDAAVKLGNVERHNQFYQEGWAGIITLTVGRNLTRNTAQMEKLIRDTDVLVDSSQRRDTTRPVVPNEWIGWLPDHAVVVDLAVDPYILEVTPPLVCGIEGIPNGSLDKYIYNPQDSEWDACVPPSIPSANRRTTVTCYSWPGIHPEACMRHYAQQLTPLFEVLMQKGYDDLSLEGPYFERALYRGTLKAFLYNGHKRERAK